MRFASVWLRATSLGAALLCSLSTGFGFTQNGATFATNGSVADINAAIAASNAGDIISLPQGTFTWTNNSVVWINKPVTLTGAGTGKTVIVLGAGEPTVSAGAIEILSSATVQNFTITQMGGVAAIPFSVNAPSNNWRITGITYNSTVVACAFCMVDSGYGIVDSCTLNSGGGENELIFARGPTNSWQLPDSMGSGDAVYIESNIFNGPGYVCDANSNARVVVRYNTITGTMKVDAHGVASNTPPRSCRHIEIYNNRWTNASLYWAAIELRGGTGMVFGNTSAGTSLNAWFYLADYSYLAQWPNFNNVYQTPVNYPIQDQIGEGMDVNGAQAAGGSDPMYVFNNTQSGAKWTRSLKIPAAGAVSLYQQQTGNTAATFGDPTLIATDRDVFSDLTVTGAFTGATGVGSGTFAQMSALQPSTVGVGFWTTDQGHWNKLTTVASGQFYVWNGTAWTLKYTPYLYPHPLRAARPNATASATSLKAGQGVTLTVPVVANATYQWQYNGGNIPGATGTRVTLSDLGAYQAGNYSALITVNGISYPSGAVVVNVSQNARLTALTALDSLTTSANMSLRAIVAGTGSKDLVIGAIGPSLSEISSLSNLVGATHLSVFDSGYSLVASDSGWSAPLSVGTSTTITANAVTPAELAAVGALPLVFGSLDSAMYVTAPVGNLTASIGSIGYDFGVAMTELYDADSLTAPSYLSMVQAGGGVNYGGSVLQVGFVISGTTSQTVLIYGLGPRVGTFGVPNGLADPRLTLYGQQSIDLGPVSLSTGSVMIAQNVNWVNPVTAGNTPYAASITPATSALMSAALAMPLTTATTDCALVATLPPGTYSVTVDSASGGSGNAMVQIYNLP